MFPKYVALLLIVLSASVTRAQMKTVTDLERVGLSDLIIVGVVEEVMNREKTVSQNTVLTPTDIAVVRIEKTLKGKSIARVDVTNLPVAAEGTKGRVYTGARLLFYLHQSRNRFKLYYAGDPFIRSVNEVDKVSALINQYPLTVKLMPLTTPFSFEKATTLTVKITNNSNKSVYISAIHLEGFYLAPTMELNLGNSSRNAQNGPHVDESTSTEVKPKATYTAQVTYAIEKPASWKAYEPETHLLTVIAVRVIVTVDLNSSQKKPQDTYLVCSPPILQLIGYPIPADL